MYLGSKKRILSTALILCVVISIISDLLSASVRYFIKNTDPSLPDMIDPTLWKMESIIAVFEIVLIAVVFAFYHKRLERYISLIPAEDRKQLGILQEESFGKNISALTAEDISKLMKIWAVILVGAQTAYYISSSLYRSFIIQLSELVDISNAPYDYFVSIYNNTHGFKYLGMVIAILLGISITGIFLENNLLKVVSVVYAIVFLIAFMTLNMQSMSILGHTVGIVWTSVLYHVIDQVGIIVLALYLRHKYPGV